MRDNLLRLLLELAHPVEVANGGRVVFDADAEQRRQRCPQFGSHLLERLDFDQSAALDAINRGTRDAELLGQFIGGLSPPDPVRLEAAADFAQAGFRYSA